jgi:serine/threonine-protein kinase
MCPDHHEPDPPLEPTIAALVNEYFDRRQAGEDLTPEQFAEEHPEFAGALRPYLEGLALIDEARSEADSSGTGVFSPSPDALPTIGGYELMEELGRGGMGVVYRALQIATKRIVAIKVMLAGPFSSPIARKRFQREVELAARLDHPGVVRILESSSVAGQPYYAMDFVDGMRLDRHLAAATPSVQEIVGLFKRICETVHIAHEHGVVHRDLKPANVLVDRQGNPHVLDFGLAKAIDQAEESTRARVTVSVPGQVVGTLAYLSPEQAAARPGDVDARTDVYALGVMMYEALTGKLPVDTQGHPSDVLRKIIEEPPPPPARASPRVDSELETIVLKALDKERDQRYASAAAMAADLDRYLGGEPILARRPSSLYVVRKKLRKHRTGIARSAGILAVAALALWLGSWWLQRVQVERTQRELAAGRLEALRIQELLEIGDVKAAVAGAMAARERYRGLAEAPVLVGSACFRDGDVAQAVHRLERVPPSHPGYWPARMLLAEIFRRGGNVARADQLAGEVRSTMPDTADNRYLLSFATLALDDALRHVRAALERDPVHALAWARLTNLQIRRGDLDGALEAVLRLRRLDAENPLWKVLHGRLHLRRGAYEEALDLLTQVIEHSDAPGTAVPFRAYAYRRLKQHEKALGDYDTILQAGQRGPGQVPIWHHYQRATPLWIVGRLEEAMEEYERVRSILGYPHYSDARRAIILLELGRKTEARAVLEAARQACRDPWLSTIFACLLGDLSPAELVDAADPHSPEHVCEAYYYAGEAALWQGDADAAANWFRQAVGTGLVWDADSLMLAPMNEYELAEWRLGTLAEPASSPSGG